MARLRLAALAGALLPALGPWASPALPQPPASSPSLMSVETVGGRTDYRVSPSSYDIDVSFRANVRTEGAVLRIWYGAPKPSGVEVREASAPVRGTSRLYDLRRSPERDDFALRQQTQVLSVEFAEAQRKGAEVRLSARVRSTEREALLYGYIESDGSECGGPGEAPRHVFTFDASAMPFVATPANAVERVSEVDVAVRVPPHLLQDRPDPVIDTEPDDPSAVRLT